MKTDIHSVLTRLKNAADILDLREHPYGMDALPAMTSVDLCKMILIDGATALDHYSGTT